MGFCVENDIIHAELQYSTTAGKSFHAITLCIHDNNMSSEMSDSGAK